MVCYNFSDLFWYIIGLWKEEKKEKKCFTSRKKEKEKKKNSKFDTRPPGIEPGPIDSETDVLTTPLSRHLK